MLLPNPDWSGLDQIIAEQDAYYGRTSVPHQPNPDRQG